MTDSNDKINQLHEKLRFLIKKHDDFSREIDNLRNELNQLKNTNQELSSEREEINSETLTLGTELPLQTRNATPDFNPSKDQLEQKAFIKDDPPVKQRPKVKSDLEKFIGENLINKIGIVITITGVAIGAKYSIENDLVSPLTRIILGYLFGLGLLGIGIKLKNNYANYSAVLVSGAMAIMYFITYFAYGLYDLIPQLMAFVLMIIFTVFTVVAAIHYNRQIIAQIGLVGAYGIPFLLNEGEGIMVILFSYIVILNIGILAIAIKKYWKPLYFTAFGVTWLIFLSWYVSQYQTSDHFYLALLFLSAFFIIFYLTFLSYKLFQKEKFVVFDIILVIINSFIFYGLGYTLFNQHPTGGQILGLFTLFNAIIHFTVSVILYQQKLADKNVHYLVSGLALIFITIAIPVQLDGKWVTLLWIGEAALLFWIGRTKNINFYERLSYPLILLAFFSILQDWGSVYNLYNHESSERKIMPLINVNFLTSVLFVIALGFIHLINHKKEYSTAHDSKNGFSKILTFFISSILLFSVYFAFRMEIAHYWNQLFTDSAITITPENQSYPNHYWNYDIKRFSIIWLINYSLLFVSILSFFNIRKFKNSSLGLVNLGFIILFLYIFLVQGLYVLSELRESYLEQTLSQFYHTGLINLWIRYLSFSMVALALFAGYRYIQQKFIQMNFKIPFDFLLHTSILWIASSELIHWMEISKSEQSYKLGLSILWGVYSFFLIAFGIWKKNKPLRIGAISLFGITLLKLFFYDISHLNTIAKTIVFVSLGMLLLIISFLYNKFKHSIANDETEI
ncbi:MAG TPA: DUF2339 domain-containing protein [Saprospiraceae bacterium]|nr:DUF2339 domain-containing protein [Saprospiraceae bacterium]